MVVVQNLKAPEILVVLLVVLLLFGGKRLPDLAKGIGKSLRILKDVVKDLDDRSSPAGDDAPAGSPAPRPSAPAERADDAERFQV